jgi:NitT/TauT family transport system substrate-binding protein
VALAAVALLVSACSGDDDADGAGSEGTGAAATGEGGDSPTVRLGYFANVTHAPAIIGVFDGLFQEQLGDTELEVATFNAGTEAIEAMFSGAIDMTFIGPNPAINGFAQSEGEALRIVAGTTSGGASLVVDDEIREIADLEGSTLATPSLGNTQDVAARAWLIDNGFAVTLEGGGDVNVVPQDNSETLAAFQSGDVQAAWVPEPWATRLVL